MEDLALATALAAVITKLVDFIRNAFDPNGRAPKWTWNVAAFSLGIGMAFAAELNLIDRVGYYLGGILTGLALGALGSAQHELFDALSGVAKRRVVSQNTLTMQTTGVSPGAGAGRVER